MNALFSGISSHPNIAIEDVWARLTPAARVSAWLDVQPGLICVVTEVDQRESSNRTYSILADVADVADVIDAIREVDCENPYGSRFVWLVQQHEAARVEDVLIDQHNAGTLELSTEAHGYEIISTDVYNRLDNLNLPAYRHEVVIVARWQDENSTHPLTETFDGYGPTWEIAEQQASQEYNAWRMRLNVIGQWNNRRAVQS